MSKLTQQNKLSLIRWLESAEWWAELPYAELRALLHECRKAIDSVPDKSVFGIGGDGTTHWYLADELLDRIDDALRGP